MESISRRRTRWRCASLARRGPHDALIGYRAASSAPEPDLEDLAVRSARPVGPAARPDSAGGSAPAVVPPRGGEIARMLRLWLPVSSPRPPITSTVPPSDAPAAWVTGKGRRASRRTLPFSGAERETARLARPDR